MKTNFGLSLQDTVDSNPLLPARDYLPDHHVRRNYFHIITFMQADTPYQAAARIEPRTNGTLHASRSTAHGAQVV